MNAFFGGGGNFGQYWAIKHFIQNNLDLKTLNHCGNFILHQQGHW